MGGKLEPRARGCALPSTRQPVSLLDEVYGHLAEFIFLVSTALGIQAVTAASYQYSLQLSSVLVQECAHDYPHGRARTCQAYKTHVGLYERLLHLIQQRGAS